MPGWRSEVASDRWAKKSRCSPGALTRPQTPSSARRPPDRATIWVLHAGQLLRVPSQPSPQRVPSLTPPGTTWSPPHVRTRVCTHTHLALSLISCRTDHSGGTAAPPAFDPLPRATCMAGTWEPLPTGFLRHPQALSCTQMCTQASRGFRIRVEGVCVHSSGPAFQFPLRQVCHCFRALLGELTSTSQQEGGLLPPHTLSHMKLLGRFHCARSLRHPPVCTRTRMCSWRTENFLNSLGTAPGGRSPVLSRTCPQGAAECQGAQPLPPPLPSPRGLCLPLPDSERCSHPI